MDHAPSGSTPPADAGQSTGTVSISVKMPNGDTIHMTLPSSTTLATVLQLLALRTSLPMSSLRLIHEGRTLRVIIGEASSSPAYTPSPSPELPTLESLRLESDPQLTLAQQPSPSPPPRTPKKIRCGASDCRAVAQRIVGDCGFCGGHFCGNHRMLEDHRCSGLEDCKNQSREQNKIKLESERTVMVRGI